jgi:hypothetical protein
MTTTQRFVTFMLFTFVLSGCAGFQEWARSPAVQEWARRPTMHCETTYYTNTAHTRCW